MCADKFFDILKNIDKRLSSKDDVFILDQKRPLNSTFGGKNFKLVKPLKRQLSKKVLVERRKTSEAEHELLRKTVDTFQLFSSASSETSSLKTNPSSSDFEDNLLF